MLESAPTLLPMFQSSSDNVMLILMLPRTQYKTLKLTINPKKSLDARQKEASDTYASYVRTVTSFTCTIYITAAAARR